MTKSEKKEKVLEIYKEQKKYLKKFFAIIKLPEPKRPSTKTKRAFRAVWYALHVRLLEAQKQIIISQPTAPNFESGGEVIKAGIEFK